MVHTRTHTHTHGTHTAEQRNEIRHAKQIV